MAILWYVSMLLVLMTTSQQQGGSTMNEDFLSKMSGLTQLFMQARADLEIDAIVLKMRDKEGSKIEFIIAPDNAIDLAGELMLSVLELTKSKRATKN